MLPRTIELHVGGELRRAIEWYRQAMPGNPPDVSPESEGLSIVSPADRGERKRGVQRDVALATMRGWNVDGESAEAQERQRPRARSSNRGGGPRASRIGGGLPESHYIQSPDHAVIGLLAARRAYPPYITVGEHLIPTVERRSRAIMTPSPAFGGHFRFIRT